MLHVVSGPNSCIIGPCQSITYDIDIERYGWIMRYNLAWYQLDFRNHITVQEIVSSSKTSTIVYWLAYTKSES